jgi:hypothetical protein
MRKTKLCGARLDRADAAFDRVHARAVARGKDADDAIRAYLRHRGFCKRPALSGSDRCQWHGGHSTGPTSEQGKANTIAAMAEGRRRWLAKLKAEGKPVPFGRKRGGKNRALDERAAAAHAREERRTLRRVEHQSRADKRARREARRQQREEQRELQHRHDAFQAGLPFWSDAAAPPPKPLPGVAPDHTRGSPAPPATPKIPTAPTMPDPDALLDEALALVASPGARKADVKLVTVTTGKGWRGPTLSVYPTGSGRCPTTTQRSFTGASGNMSKRSAAQTARRRDWPSSRRRSWTLRSGGRLNRPSLWLVPISTGPS